MRLSLLAPLGLLLVVCPHASGAQGLRDPQGVQGVQGVRSAEDVRDVRDLPAATVEPGEPRPGPPPPLPDISDPNGRAGEALNEPGERSGIPKALRSSGAKAGGPANDLNPSGKAEAPAPPKGDLGRVIAGKELFHGNYCGTGQRGEGLPPTDALDAACMRHDACYDAAGYRSCGCDAALKREASAVSDSPDAALEVRRRALSVIEAASAMECRAP